ncbi:MAG: oxaloacetate decarboxylase [Acidimicrobiales bacterium]
MNAADRLRAILSGTELVVAPFVYDALQAKVAAAAGFGALYCTGFGTAASYGLPDVGLLGLQEMAANGRRISGAVEVPVICDADTGFGNAVNVARTVREYAAAGIAALHLEDQVWPKRCGFMTGKEVIPAEEAVQKVRAAVDASRSLHSGRDDYGADEADGGERRGGGAGPVIIARTDALAPHGWDEVESRARAFAEVGAELIFVDGLRTRADAERCAHRLGDLPLVYNGMLASADVAALGFKLQLHSGPLMAGFAALEGIYAQLAATGRVELDGVGGLFDRLNALLGLAEVEALRLRYAAGDQPLSPVNRTTVT